MTRSSGAIQLRRESGEHWDEFAVEVDSNQLLDRVIEAEDVSDERVEALLCGAVKQLRAQRAKPDPSLYLTLCYLAKTRPLLFCTEIVVEAFCSLLKRDSSLSFKTKGNNLVSILAGNLLLAVYHDETSWPDTFLKVFIEDSLGERVWVDHEDCKGFVDNILASFNTKLPPKAMMQQDLLITTKLGEVVNTPSSPNHPNQNQSEDNLEETPCSSLPMSLEMKEHLENIAIMSRFTHNEEFVIQFVTDIINEQLNRRQAPSDISRNMLKLLVSTAGIPAVRLIVAQKLEIWIQNPKVSYFLCFNFNLRIIAYFIK
jgi:integrator complex subunit 1